MSIKMSVIVPVYNMEDYLDTCVKSLLKQGVEDIEIILVDDCSIDHSGVLCDEWAEKDSRIRVIHCAENGGLSEARNCGLAVAQGEYVTFVDSDDFVAENTYQANVALLDANRDVAVLEFPVNVDYGSIKAREVVPGKNEKVSFVEWIEQKGYCHCYAWNKIYRRSVWQGQQFPKGKLMEDLFTIPYLLSSVDKIMLSDEGMYYYCSREGTISRSVNPRSAGDYLRAYVQLYEWLKECKDMSEMVLDDVYLRMSNAHIIMLQLGEKRELPRRRIPLNRAVKSAMPLKAVACSMLGSNYSVFVAKLRKLLKK